MFHFRAQSTELLSSGLTSASRTSSVSTAVVAACHSRKLVCFLKLVLESCTLLNSEQYVPLGLIPNIRNLLYSCIG